MVVSAQSFVYLSVPGIKPIALLCFVTALLFTTTSNVYIHALMRAAQNFSLLRRKTTPDLHII